VLQDKSIQDQDWDFNSNKLCASKQKEERICKGSIACRVPRTEERTTERIMITFLESNVAVRLRDSERTMVSPALPGFRPFFESFVRVRHQVHTFIRLVLSVCPPTPRIPSRDTQHATCITQHATGDTKSCFAGNGGPIVRRGIYKCNRSERSGSARFRR
jgi:hypothetical protein